MVVADLQKFLRSLSDGLNSGGAKNAANELAEVCEKLDTFSQFKLKDFAAFLVRAEALSRGELPDAKKAGNVKAGKDPARLQQATLEIKQLHARFNDPSMSRNEVETVVRRWANLTKSELEAAGKAIGMVRKLSKKDEVLKAIIQTIMDAQGAFQRAQC